LSDLQYQTTDLGNSTIPNSLIPQFSTYAAKEERAKTTHQMMP
jgi:hypothetical protein